VCSPVENSHSRTPLPSPRRIAHPSNQSLRAGRAPSPPTSFSQAGQTPLFERCPARSPGCASGRPLHRPTAQAAELQAGMPSPPSPPPASLPPPPAPALSLGAAGAFMPPGFAPGGVLDPDLLLEYPGQFGLFETG
jgi:hypothetical protein